MKPVAWLRQALLRRRGSVARAPDRWYLEHAAECREYLVTRTRWLAERNGVALVIAVAQRPASDDEVVRRLRGLGIEVQVIPTGDLGARASFPPAAAVACLDLDSRGIASAARACMNHPQLRTVAFEYATATRDEYATLLQHDDPHYGNTHFHSPLLTDPHLPFAIYEESLARFERKCDVRDFMDLYQVLRQVVELGLPGDIVEFGSYKGHSGYLIARTLRALGVQHRIHLFDTFAAFPQEQAGVDQFWSDTHAVNFDEVRGKFADLPEVTLVRGDFTHTLQPALAGRRLAAVHVDCDSYRAVRYVAEQTWPLLSPRGLMVFEDYGHPALLGARLAVEEFATAHRECFRFFSQFSGLYILQKPAD
ncbi:MAG TPA: TylF/MycF/NovP-related O-methyltransferase [Verrucomicrobiae bacterium]|nr:TylF/MycF/NovP-related O-methyltransferase [Verrucomicrobiae bacterium]